jgi:hypothetical protein
VLGLLVEVGGLVAVDLHCDFLVDERGLPVSSHAGSLDGLDADRPGGILRQFIQVRPGQ